MSVSVLILTLNEEMNLRRCVESVRWSDDIVVVDSGSTDGTLEIAAELGLRVVHRKLETWAEHQNWINESVSFKNEWVYYSDADEVVTAELARELRGIAASRAAHVAYRVRYKNFFLGRWLKHSGGYPIWALRFFRPDKVRWERLVNPVPMIEGSEGRLRGHFLHYSFNKGFDAWFEKHNKYSRLEAFELVKARERGHLSFSGLVSADSSQRRRALKEISFFLPARGLLRFCLQYFLRLGFLDGAPGFHWSVLMAYYEYMISMKAVEIRRRARGLEI